jgi:3-hydroxybutyryl-CoA dehydrogenase
MAIKSVGIIGAGTMGNGIAQACAVVGIDAVMLDINEAAVQKGVATVSGSLDRLVKKEKMTAEQKAAAMARIKPTTQMADMKAVDIVIEAATENLGLKLKILKEVEAAIGADTIIASNTSSISITQLAAATGRADRFIGMHFFNPVPLMALVELIRGLQTSDATHAEVEALAKALGKTPITVKNNPGFVVNRILCPMINEAIFVYSEGLASAEEIDAGMKLGCNHPDRSAGAGRHDRPRHHAGGDECVLRGLQRFQVPSGAAPEGNGRRGLPRAQDRARLLPVLTCC